MLTVYFNVTETRVELTDVRNSLKRPITDR